jgi:phage baseplate assembly protein W
MIFFGVMVETPLGLDVDRPELGAQVAQLFVAPLMRRIDLKLVETEMPNSS